MSIVNLVQVSIRRLCICAVAVMLFVSGCQVFRRTIYTEKFFVTVRGLPFWIAVPS